MWGSDLNRWFLNSDPALNPVVWAIKRLVSDIFRNFWIKRNPIIGYVDFHAHYRKKSVFWYGPYYPLHDERYLKIRLIPKLLSLKT